MPYTQEELKKLSFYQELINEDEQQYLQKKAALSDEAFISGSANDGNLLLRDKSNAILLFEDPYKNQLLEDESSKAIHNLKVRKLKTKESDMILKSLTSSLKAFLPPAPVISCQSSERFSACITS